MIETVDHVSSVVEGDGDEAVVRRLLDVTGYLPRVSVDFLGKRGKGDIDKKLAAYDHAARFSAWLVLRDLDREEPCAAALVRRLLPRASTGMKLRIAVQEAEAWLLADRERIARFLGVAVSLLPRDADAVPDPKQTLVNLARRSKKREIRLMAPADGKPGVEGRLYTAKVIEFAMTSWEPDEAAARSNSLERCLRRLREGWPSFGEA